MPLKMIWPDESQLDAVALTRLRCYAPAANELTRYRENLANDRRGKVGDYLLAERDGRFVGTATSLSMNMWVRGGRVPCQGVAFVGTIKTARRGGSKTSGEKGIASQIMFETLRRGRERGEVVSALMPFRASFYEHFGYGLAERRTEWVVPLSLLPQTDFDGLRFKEPADHDEIIRCRQRVCEAGQCDIETTPGAWEMRWKSAEGGMEIVDRPDDRGAVHSFMYLLEERRDGRAFVKVQDWGAESIDALRRQLGFLGGLKDQYTAAIMVLPGDVPLNRLLKESQIPHRPVEHSVAAAKPYTRMQIRVLDHRRFVEAMQLPPRISGKVVVAVRETEGTVSRFRIDLSDGRPSVSPSDASADAELSDVNWASLASGDIPAIDAARWGLMTVNHDDAVTLLNVFSAGRVPFCGEYF